MWDKIKKNFFENLRNKYRLVVLNDETFEERISVKLSRMNVYIATSTLFLLMLIGVLLLIINTPLKEYLPGYGDMEFREQLKVVRNETDSLAILVKRQDAYINSIKKIVNEDFANDSINQITTDEKKDYSDIDIERVSKKDSLLRAEVEEQLRYSLANVGDAIIEEDTIETNYFPPIEGYVTSEFEPEKEHFGIDLVAPLNSPIKAVLPGTVVISNWTVETGYVIGIQHNNNILSFYKHNSILLKKVGNFVKAGDVIAIVGESGEQSTGPHLHFELWQNKSPVNPRNYIAFN